MIIFFQKSDSNSNLTENNDSTEDEQENELDIDSSQNESFIKNRLITNQFNINTQFEYLNLSNTTISNYCCSNFSPLVNINHRIPLYMRKSTLKPPMNF